MPYGDRINPATDDFSTDPFAARWNNGYADWDPWTWTASDYIENVGATDKGARRDNEGAYPNNQYSIVTLQAALGTNSWAATAVRMQNSATDESCYVGYIRTGGANDAIYEISAAFGFTDLGGNAQTSPTTGQTIVTEAEGTTIRLGTNQSGTDTQTQSATDATIASGRPGVVCYDGATEYDAWEGGEIGVAGGAGAPPPRRLLTLGVGG